MTIRFASANITFPLAGEIRHVLESLATICSNPVPTMGAFGYMIGTDWRCIFEPINARFASSCSTKGINADATLKI